MQMNTADSLSVVIETGLRALRQYTAELATLEKGDRQVPATLKAVVSEADVLSAALTRLAQSRASKLPAPNVNEARNRPEVATEIYDHLCKVNGLFEHGVCERCGGVLRSPRQGAA